MIRRLFTSFLVLVLMAGSSAFAASNFTITSSTSGSSTRFIVTRSGEGTNAAETVRYRTVGLSAYAGQHFTAQSGTLNFAAGKTALTNTVTETTPIAAAYKFQTDTSRSYRFELIDAGGFLVTNATRSLTTGTRVTASDAFGEKDLPINAGTITVTDGGYDQAYHSVIVNNYFTDAAPKDYLIAAGAQLRATVTFHAREKDDGYQYVAIYANTSTSNVDTGAKDGDPGTVSYSRYMAGFTIDGNVSSTWYPYTFPLTSKGHDCGEQTHPWSGNSNGNLKQQYFKSNCRAADGRLSRHGHLSHHHHLGRLGHHSRLGYLGHHHQSRQSRQSPHSPHRPPKGGASQWLPRSYCRMAATEICSPTRRAMSSTRARSSS